MPTDITATDAWKKLQQAADRDQRESPGFHDYAAKLEWIKARVAHYEEKTGIPGEKILERWEADRSYWYMNFYQDANQPTLDKVRVFPTVEVLRESVGDKGFRCPSCGGVSKDSTECDSGLMIGEGKKAHVCNWKAYGFLGTMGKGVDILVIDTPDGGFRQGHYFMPVAWES